MLVAAGAPGATAARAKATALSWFRYGPRRKSGGGIPDRRRRASRVAYRLGLPGHEVGHVLLALHPDCARVARILQDAEHAREIDDPAWP